MTLWQDDACRVIRAATPDHPGFCRVVWHAHVVEMSDLSTRDRRHLMDVVFATEAALRVVMRPDKINLASFGNVVPHLHWHVIPRFTDDRHFPEPVWGSPQRAATPRVDPGTARLTEEIRLALAARES